MKIRSIGGLGAFVLFVVLAQPWPVAAQRQPRWIAGPQLLTPSRSAPNDFPTINDVADAALLNESTGWAVSRLGYFRFDGQHWRLAQQSPESNDVNAINLVSATNGWAVGGHIFYMPGSSTAPYQVPVLTRLNGTRWDAFPLPRDATNNEQHGQFTDVAALPDGTAWIVGATRQDYNQPEQPWLLFFDGTAWQNRTPAAWRYGYLSKIQMVSPNELWVAGQFRDTAEVNPTIPGRPVLLHYKDGAWTEAALPALGPTSFYVTNLLMRDASEGWATLYEIGPCAQGALLHYKDGAWTRIDPATHGNAPVALGLIPGTNRGWATLFESCSNGGIRYPSRRMRFDNGSFTPDTNGGTQLLPDRYILLNDQVQWATGSGAFMRYTAAALPTDRVAGNVPGGRYFATTGHTISGLFRQYYETHGLEFGDRGISDRESLALFGYPISQPFEEVNADTGEVLLVQYFERARMEYHPNNPDPYKILLGRLGFNTLVRTSNGFLSRSPDADQPAPANCDRYIETGYTLCPPFRSYWRTNGGLPGFGFPLTDAFPQTNPTDNKEYLSQWFERERLEYHPENRGTPYVVLLGLLGSEELRVRGYLP